MYVAALVDLSPESCVLVGWLQHRGCRVLGMARRHGALYGSSPLMKRWSDATVSHQPPYFSCDEGRYYARFAFALAAHHHPQVEAAAIGDVRGECGVAVALGGVIAKMERVNAPALAWWVPFQTMGLVDVLRLGRAVGARLDESLSCKRHPLTATHRTPLHCGECADCQLRAAAFRAAELEDKAVYGAKPAVDQELVDRLAAKPRQVPPWPIH